MLVDLGAGSDEVTPLVTRCRFGGAAKVLVPAVAARRKRSDHLTAPGRHERRYLWPIEPCGFGDGADSEQRLIPAIPTALLIMVVSFVYQFVSWSLSFWLQVGKTGRGMAIAGLVLAYIGVATLALFIIFLVLVTAIDTKFEEVG